MGRKPKPKMSCRKCGKTMEVENTSKARYTVFVLWKCNCGHQQLEKKHVPVASRSTYQEPTPREESTVRIDEIPEYCQCGIKMVTDSLGVKGCPRCRDIEMVEKDMTTYESPKDLTGIVSSKEPDPLVAPEEPTQDCPVCDATMEAGCSKVCPNCNWVSPCGSEGP